MLLDHIYNEHCVDTMRLLDDGVFDSIITSPPYWGLRDYQTVPLVWGGIGCEHEFESDGAYHDNMRYRAGDSTTVGNNINPAIYTIKKTGGTTGGRADYHRTHDISESSAFCLKCGAWRGNLGLEPTFNLYIDHLVEIFAECKRVLKDTGVMWINIGDSYASSGSRDTRFYHGDNVGKHRLNGDGNLSKEYSGRCRTDDVPSKSLCGIPERLALALTDRVGLIRRNTIIWHKPNCMPASVKDRFTVDFEYVYMFTKSQRYYFEQQFEASVDPESYTGRRPRNAPTISKHDLKHCQVAGKIKDGKLNDAGKAYPNRNKRCVWRIATKPFPEAHFATYPTALIEPMIKSSVPCSGIVYDPFMGAGTTGLVAKMLGRHYVGSELNSSYISIANRRIAKETELRLF